MYGGFNEYFGGLGVYFALEIWFEHVNFLTSIGI